MRSLLTTIATIILLVLSTSNLLASTWYIKADGTGDAPTIQAGIDLAAVADTVILADGTYTGVGNRDIDYNGKAITIRSESGDPQLCVIDCQQAGRGFQFHSGEGPGSVLEGVTITNGYMNVTQSGFGGGAILCDGASPTITACTILNNFAAHAGGMECINSAAPTVTQCTFTGNQVDWGGGAVLSSSLPTFTACTFSGNYASFGGGIDGSAILDDCTFSGNSAQWEGGGVNGSATMTNCLFSGNRAENGGGMYGSATMTNCLFSGNQAYDDGGAYWGSATMTNCTFVNNSADRGGALYYVGASSIAYCTLYQNSASINGGGVYCFNASPDIDNTIIAFGGAGEAVFCDGTSAPTLDCCDVFGNAGGDWVGCIAGQSGVNHNISADPAFCDPDAGDFYLQTGSPCVWDGCPPQIGAFPIGCGSVFIEEKTWGAIKAIYID